MKANHGKRRRGYVERLISYRVTILAIVLAAVCLCAFGLTRLGFAIDNRIYFDPSNAERLALEAVERDHGRYANAVLVIAPQSGSILTPANLELLREAGNRVATQKDVVRAVSILTQPTTLPDGPPLLDEDTKIDASTSKRIEAVVEERQPDIPQLISKDNSAAAIVALIRVDAEKPDLQVAAARAIDDIRAEFSQKYPNVDFYLTGDAILDSTFIEAILRDLISLVPFQVGATVVLLLLSLQSALLTAALLLLLGSVVVITMGAAGLAGLELNGVTGATPVILMGLSIATSIHLIFAWQRERREGRDCDQALGNAMRLNVFPITLAAATTVVSFLCMNFSDAPPFRELGNLVAFGLFVNWLLAFTALPVLIRYFPHAVGSGRSGVETGMAGFGEFTIRYRRPIIAVSVLAAALSVWGITKLEFDDRFAHYFDESFDFRVSTDFYEREFSGLTVLQFSLPAVRHETVWSHAYLTKIDRFETWLRGQPNVTRVEGLPDLVRGAAQAMPGHEAGMLPRTGKVLDQISSRMREDISGGATPHLLVTKDNERSLLTATLRAVSSSDIRAFAEAAETWLKIELPDNFAPAVGVPLISAYMSERNANAMVAGTLAALIIVSLMMFFMLDSLKLGFVSLVPNLVPMTLALGFWGIAFGQASFAVTVVSAITYGLVVDGTIHILSKYRYARETLKLPVREAVMQGMSTVGLAVLATSLAVASGFAIMSFSGFLVNYELGLLSCMILIAALLADLLFLPALVFSIDRDADPLDIV